MKINEEQLLARVKEVNNYTGEYQDKRIMGYIKDVKRFMAGTDVPAAVLETDAVVGLIAMGVDCLMETGALTDYVKMRIIQERLTDETEASG